MALLLVSSLLWLVGLGGVWARLVVASAALIAAGALLRRGALYLLTFALFFGSVAAGCTILVRRPESLWMRGLAFLCFAAALGFVILGAALQSVRGRRAGTPARRGDERHTQGD